MQMQYGFMLNAGRNQMNEANYAANGGASFLGGAIQLGNDVPSTSNFNDFMTNLTGGGMGLGGNMMNSSLNPFESLNPQNSLPQQPQQPATAGANPQFNPFANPEALNMSGAMNSPSEKYPLMNPYENPGGFGGAGYGQPFPTNYGIPAGPTPGHNPWANSNGINGTAPQMDQWGNPYGGVAWGNSNSIAPQMDQWANPYGGGAWGAPQNQPNFGQNPADSNANAPAKKSTRGKKG